MFTPFRILILDDNSIDLIHSSLRVSPLPSLSVNQYFIIIHLLETIRWYIGLLVFIRVRSYSKIFDSIDTISREWEPWFIYIYSYALLKVLFLCMFAWLLTVPSTACTAAFNWPHLVKDVSSPSSSYQGNIGFSSSQYSSKSYILDHKSMSSSPVTCTSHRILNPWIDPQEL